MRAWKVSSMPHEPRAAPIAARTVRTTAAGFRRTALIDCDLIRSRNAAIPRHVDTECKARLSRDATRHPSAAPDFFSAGVRPGAALGDDRLVLPGAVNCLARDERRLAHDALGDRGPLMEAGSPDYANHAERAGGPASDA